MRKRSTRLSEVCHTSCMLAAIMLLKYAAQGAIAGDGIAVTADVLLQDTSDVWLQDVGIPKFVWAGDGAGLIVSIAGPLRAPDVVPGSATGPQSVELKYISTYGTRVTLGNGQWPLSAPNGRLAAYRTGDDGWMMRTLVITRLDGQEVCRVKNTMLSPTAARIDALAWSPDAGRLAVATSTRDREKTRERTRTATVMVYANEAMASTMSPMPEDGVSIWSIDAACGDTRHVVDLPYAHVCDVVWLADRQTLAVCALAGEAGRTHTRADLLFVNTRDGLWHVAVSNIGGQTGASLMPSPDGRLVAFEYDEEGLPYLRRQTIAIAAVADGSIHLVSRDLRANPQWTSDGRRLWLSTEAAHVLLTHKTLVSLDGSEVAVPDLPGSARLSPQGNRVAWTETDLYGASTLWMADLAYEAGVPRLKQRRRLLQVAAPLAQYRRGERRLLQWPSKDGLWIAGVLVLPIDYRPGRRYPMIVDLHGGPRKGLMASYGKPQPGSLLVTSSLEPDMWATKGYAVLMPDYRGSGMYGFQAIDVTRKDASIDDRNLEDIMQGVDTVIALGIADESRMVVIGHSHGAYLTNWIVTHSHRFRAAISYEGSSASPWIVWGAMGTVNRHLDMLYGSALEHPERYWRRSALAAARGVTIPTMWVSAYGGTRLGNVYAWLHAAWLSQGIETQYRVYAESNHILRDTGNQRDLLIAGIEWIDRHLGPASARGIPTPSTTAMQ